MLPPPGAVVFSAQSLATLDQDFELRLLPPPGAVVFSAQSWDFEDHDFELLVLPPPGFPLDSAQLWDFEDQDFALFELVLAGSGGNPDCAQSLALSLYPAALFALLFALVAEPPAAAAELKELVA